MTDSDRHFASAAADAGRSPVRPAGEAADYDEALRIVDKEAAATLAAALLLMIFFWGAVFLLEDLPLFALGFPLWFWAAVVGGYVLSVAVVVMLVKVFFKNFSLDLRPEDAKAKEEKASSETADGGVTLNGDRR